MTDSGIGQVILFLTAIIGFLLQYLRESRTRRWNEEDRVTQRDERKQDAEFLARHTQDEARKLAETVTDQHREVLKSVAENTEVSVKAFVAANHIADRQAAATQAIADSGRRMSDIDPALTSQITTELTHLSEVADQHTVQLDVIKGAVVKESK